jgi:hypothetical protein
MKWSKEFPKEDGWYWCKYWGKHGPVICPTRLRTIFDVTIASTAYSDTFYSDNRFNDNGNLKFGNKIRVPK